MESSLKNMVLTLLVITLVSASALSMIYNVTKGPIEESKKAKTVAALSGVLPEFDNNPAEDTVTLYIDELPAKVYTAKKGSEKVGYAVETITKKGFSGEIKLMAGFLPNGEIRNIEVLEHSETPGLGSKMTEPGNPLLVSFVGKNPADLQMKVTKEGGDIDVITASTISSRAYTDAVERAYKAFQATALGMETEEMEPVDPFEIVFPGYAGAGTIVVDAVEIEVGGVWYPVYTALRNDKVCGYAVESVAEGYHGDIKLMTGFTPAGEIYGIYIMEHGESGKFDAEMEKGDNPLITSLRGRNPLKTDMRITSEGGEIEAVTGSTVSSAAYIEAVRKASEALSKIIREDGNE